MTRFYAVSYPRDYEEAKRSWARAHSSEPICDRNTRLVRRSAREYGRPPMGPASFAVRFHRTDVVTFHPDGSVELDSGGWGTNSTRNRMEACGISLWSELGIWAVETRKGRFRFEPHMRILPDGSCRGIGGFLDSRELEEAKRDERRRRNREAYQRAKERKRAKRLAALRLSMEARARWMLSSPAERLAARLEGARIPAGIKLDAPQVRPNGSAECSYCRRAWRGLDGGCCPATRGQGAASFLDGGSWERSGRRQVLRTALPVYAPAAPASGEVVPVGGIL